MTVDNPDPREGQAPEAADATGMRPQPPRPHEGTSKDHTASTVHDDRTEHDAVSGRHGDPLLDWMIQAPSIPDLRLPVDGDDQGIRPSAPTTRPGRVQGSAPSTLHVPVDHVEDSSYYDDANTSNTGMGSNGGEIAEDPSSLEPGHDHTGTMLVSDNETQHDGGDGIDAGTSDDPHAAGVDGGHDTAVDDTHTISNAGGSPVMPKEQDGIDVTGHGGHCDVAGRAFKDRIDALIDQIEARLKIVPDGVDEIGPDGFEDLGQSMGIDLKAVYHVRYSREPGTEDPMDAVATDDRSTDSNGGVADQQDGASKAGWSKWPLFGRRAPKAKPDTVLSETVGKDGKTPIPAKEVFEGLKAGRNEPLRPPILGWLVVFSEDGRDWAYERRTMSRPIEVVHSDSGMEVTGRGTASWDTMIPALPEWARKSMITRVTNAETVRWVPLYPKDTDGLPSGAVYYGFRSRGYSYGEMVDRKALMASR